MDDFILRTALVQNGKLNLRVLINYNKHGPLDFEIIPIIALIKLKITIDLILGQVDETESEQDLLNVSQRRLAAEHLKVKLVDLAVELLGVVVVWVDGLLI